MVDGVKGRSWKEVGRPGGVCQGRNLNRGFVWQVNRLQRRVRRQVTWCGLVDVVGGTSRWCVLVC